MSIAVQPIVPLVAAQGVTADVVLQPGTVIAAQVLQVIGNDQVRISIGGQSLDVVSQIPLQAGQTLQLSVSQTASGDIGLALVNPPAATAISQGLGGPAIANIASADAVSNLIMSASAATSEPLASQQALAVSAAAQTAATRQTGLSSLFANLSSVAISANLPLPVQQAAAQVLAKRTSLDSGLTGTDIRRAFETSGLFLEASLASGGSVSGPSPSSPAAVPDLKAALIVLRQVLAAALDGTAASPAAAPATLFDQQTVAPLPANGSPTAAAALSEDAPAQTTGAPALAPTAAPSGIMRPYSAADMQANVFDSGAVRAGTATTLVATPADAAARSAAGGVALNLLQELVQQGSLGSLTSAALSRFGGSAMLSLLPAAAGLRVSGAGDAERARTQIPPPPIAGAVPAAQPVLPATLPANAATETAIHHLLADTDGAIARQTLLQVASLPHSADGNNGRPDPITPRWNFEIPFVTPQGTAMAQFEIARDGSRETEAAARVWRARFSLDVEPAGPVHVLIALSGERTSVRMWAERLATADQLRAGVTQLSQALSRADLVPGDIVIRDGAPAATAAPRAGHFVDRAL